MSSTIVLSIVCYYIVAIGCVGNVFVIFVLLRDRKAALSGSINLLLLNLAFADLGNLIACSPDVAVAVQDSSWFLPEFACPVLHFLQEFFLYASVLMQLAIGIERYMAICSPLRLHRIPRETTFILILVCWLAAAIFTLPYLICQKVWHSKNGLYSACMWSGIFADSATIRTAYKGMECILFYFAPFVLLSILYSVMGRVLWGVQVGEMAVSDQILRLRRSVVKMLVISLILYFICYSPMQVLFIGRTLFDWSVNFPSSNSLTNRLIFNALSFSSSSANPIVYIVCCQHFRNRFWSLFRYCCPARYTTVTLVTEDFATSAAPSRKRTIGTIAMESV